VQECEADLTPPTSAKHSHENQKEICNTQPSAFIEIPLNVAEATLVKQAGL
jgi:hypothetical protein